MLKRILEPEVMDTETEARDYDAMDHREVNARFVSDLLEVLGTDFIDRMSSSIQVLDVGAGTALIPIELCRRFEGARITAIDLSAWMLNLGRRNVQAAGVEDRIQLERVDAKAMPYGAASFDLVLSNSIVHHIADPEIALREMIRVTAPGGIFFVRDLVRPQDEPTVAEWVEIYAGGANEHQRSLFEASLRAALTVAEMRELVAKLGLAPEEVRQTTDRHWTWSGRRITPEIQRFN